MKNIKKLLTFIFLSLVILLPKGALASSFDKIDIDVNIDKNGIGNIDEQWSLDERDNDFTERYKKIENLRGLKIDDFSVSMDGKDFSDKNPWDVDANFEQKAYKYGRIDDDSGVELCWGISKRSDDNTYKLNYKINPLVVGLNDSDMVYFNFVGDDLDPKPENINITIKGYKAFDSEVSMWGFGFIGDIHNKDGAIVAKSTGEIKNATILLKFPKGSFATSYKEDKDFSYYADLASSGSDWEDKQGTTSIEEDSPLGAIAIMIFVGLAAIIGPIAYIKSSKKYKLVNKKELTKVRHLQNQYYENIPYDGPIEDMYFLLKVAFSHGINYANYINAYFLKWSSQGAISFIEDDKKHIFGSDKSEIIINHSPEDMTSLENRIFNILIGAQQLDPNRKLNQKSINRYFEKYVSRISDLPEKFEQNSVDQLVKHGYLEVLSSNKKGKKSLRMTPKGIDLYEKLIKFNNYLEDYQRIKPEDITSTEVLDKLIIYAAIFGISQRVYDDFIDFYPYYAANTVYHPHMINTAHKLSTSPSASFSQASSGGSTSFGGGGGSFGGGGGGGR